MSVFEKCKVFGKCKECWCRTGGGDYCYHHAPYTVTPLIDGTFRVDRPGRRTRVSLDPPPYPFDVALVQLAQSRDMWRRQAFIQLALTVIACIGIVYLTAALKP